MFEQQACFHASFCSGVEFGHFTYYCANLSCLFVFFPRALIESFKKKYFDFTFLHKLSFAIVALTKRLKMHMIRERCRIEMSCIGDHDDCSRHRSGSEELPFKTCTTWHQEKRGCVARIIEKKNKKWARNLRRCQDLLKKECSRISLRLNIRN